MLKFLALLILVISCTHQAPSTKKSQAKYVRKDWPHWSDADKNCRNTRQEILISRSKNKAQLNKRGCTVVSGVWEDYYYPETHRKAKLVDIDHVIPLKHAHENGGASWSRKQKEAFANDPQNLVVTNRSYNRKKGAKGIDEWLPVHESYACRYIKDWVSLKTKYQLEVTLAEKITIAQSKCP